MMEKLTNTPKLRFPEFKGEWEKKKLGEVAERIGDGLHGTPIYSDDSDIYFINGNNLTNGKIEINENTKKVDYSIFAKNDKGLNSNTLLVSINGTIGNISKYSNEKVMLGKSVGYFNFKENTDFYYHNFQTDTIQDFFISELTGSTIKNLSLKTLRNTVISFPSLPEQARIASFFTVLDKKIAELKQKKTLLEQYKKGVMQKLFSQELRFKDEEGKEFPEWEEKTLGEVCEIIMGQSPSSNSYNLEEIGIPLIQGNADIQNRLSNPRNWTTEKTKECKIGDLILTVRAPVGAVAKSIHDACLGRGVCAIRNNSKSKIEFIYQFLLDYESKWSNIEQGSTFTAVSGVEIKKLKIFIPIIAEQTKIANFLSAIDEKINRTENQIQKTQEWKKGLLQQMFC